MCRRQVANTLHEVRNPLNSIIMGIELITPSDEEERERLLMMQESSQFILSTLDDGISPHDITV